MRKQWICQRYYQKHKSAKAEQLENALFFQRKKAIKNRSQNPRRKNYRIEREN
jgi:hypothetical protein